MDSIRTGRISSVNYETGTVNIVYNDRDESAIEDASYLTFNNEYKMPEIDDMVLTLHLSNDSTIAIALGTLWNGANMPIESGKGLYRKDFGAPGEAYLRYDNGVLSINAKRVTINTDKETFEF